MGIKGLMMLKNTVLVVLILLFSATCVLAAVGDVWLEPAIKNVSTNQQFDIEVHVDSGSLKLGSYDITITFDPSLVNVVRTLGNNGTDAGPDGLGVNVPNADNTNGRIRINGLDPFGKGPGSNLHILTIHFTSLAAGGTSNLALTVDTLTDNTGTNTIGNPNGTGATVNITAPPAPQHTLSVTVNGSGSVTSSPAGIDCPGTCSAGFDEDTDVTLTATPAASYTFAGWSGACSGTGPCTVTMDRDQQVTATFNGPGTVGFESGSTSATENRGTVTVRVCRTGGTNGPASVSYSTQDGTAVAGQDYQAASGTLTWNDGEGGCKTFPITLIDNDKKDGTKTFSIALSGLSGVDPGTYQTIQITIADDEAITSVPTMNEWGMMIFSLFAIIGGLFYYRRHPSLS